MAETVSAALGPWANFYIMTGSAAAALTGLMFVVITLVSEVERVEKAPDGIATFSTPTVVHFCAALLSSALMSVPWRSLIQPAALLGVAGLLGIVYVFRLTFRVRRLSTYSPDLEDWTWYTGFPFVAYGAILSGAIGLVAHPVSALFALGGGVLLLIVIGIRNAWDVVTYLTVGSRGDPPSST